MFGVLFKIWGNAVVGGREGRGGEKITAFHCLKYILVFRCGICFVDLH